MPRGKARFGQNSGPSRGGLCGRALRPTEASKAAAGYVRNTSILLKNSEIEVPRKSHLSAHSVVYIGSCHSNAY